MSSARRQSSTTSLAKFAHAHPEPPGHPSGLDFCNAFWGQGDAGYDVLLARMRGAMRTMEELGTFFKERAAIEADYAGRLVKLAKMSLGKDEIGDLRTALDILKGETEKQANAHQDLASKLRLEMEMPTTQFITRQVSHKKTVQATIEKAFKNKQVQESYAQKAREKYESDCLKINSYTAQQSLMQGKDLDKLRLKLEKTQASIAGNEREYQQFTRALADTTKKWEADWKAFCDGCQDMEDDRIEFLRDTVWGYANAVSSVCVSDDESCEQVRVGLENVEVDRDMENFVVSYGTGSFIPEPPRFVDYGPNGLGDTQSGNARKGREARFQRVSKKGAYPPQEEEAAMSVRSTSRANTPHRESIQLPTPVAPASSAGAPPAAAAGRYDMYGAPAAPVHRSNTSTGGEPVMLEVGGRAYAVDPSADPQRGGTSRQPSVSGSVMSTGTGTSAPLATPGDANDPLAQAMNELRQNSIKRGPGAGPSRHGTLASPTSAASTGSHYSQMTGPPQPPLQAQKLPSPPQPPQPINYDSISASIVGGPPPGSSTSPPSAQPRAAFMDPPQLANTALPVDQVLSTYGQSFPEERERRLSSSRPGSRLSQAPTQQQQQQLQRPVSPAREGFAGIGAMGRSPSPQFHPPPPQHAQLQQERAPSQNSTSRYGQRAVSPAPSGHLQRPVSPAVRPVSPASPAGIALDDRGRVVQDSLAEDYERKRREEEQRRQEEAERQQQQRMREEEERKRRMREEEDRARRQREEEERLRRLREEEERIRRLRAEEESRAQRAREEEERRRQLQQAQQQQAQQPPYYPAPPRGYPPAQNTSPAYPPPQGQQTNGYPQQPQQPLQHQPSVARPPQQPVYQQQPPSTQYVPPPPPQAQPVYQQPPPQQPGYANYPPQPQQQGGYAPEPPQAPQPPKQAPPTGTWTSTGEGILFYVKALYDYKASIDEEFDFQAGDVIAVTATPEDGWWSGELLDDQRRQPGKNIFPSNFVCLF